MKRLLGALLLLMGLGLAGPSLAGEEGEGPLLRHWMVGLQSASIKHSDHDVFAHPSLPGQEVDHWGQGAGLMFGRRFGQRFILGLQLAAANHELAQADWDLMDVEALITGTVLWRAEDTLQPFLRGGFGGGGAVLYLPDDQGNVFSFGTVANAGGGLNLRLSSRFSLEVEALATFNNFLEVRNESDDPRFPAEESWQVRTSRQGWRLGAGVLFWF